MKYMKMLGVAAIMVSAVMAVGGASSASAAGVLCSAQESPCSAANKVANGTGTEWTLSISGSLKETGASGETLDTCKKSALKGSITNGSSTTNATGSISSLTWEECTWTTTTILSGGGEVENISGTHNGRLKANSETRVTISIPFFGSCVYGVTSGTTMGTVTEGKPATFDANAVASKLSGSSITCPSTANVAGTYTQTIPSNTTLSVEAS